MNGVESFLDSYGLAAIAGVLLVKAAGVPLPLPSDLVMLAAAARIAAGKLDAGLAFFSILFALVLGGFIQFSLARGPGRSFLYRFGRYLGLTPPRLDAATARVKKSNAFGIGLAVLTPGVKVAAVAACGLAGLESRVFLTGLALGSSLDLALHFFLGYLGGPLLAGLFQAVPPPLVITLSAAGLLAGLGAWYLIRQVKRREASRGETLAGAYEAWQEAVCPVCLALGATSRFSKI